MKCRLQLVQNFSDGTSLFPTEALPAAPGGGDAVGCAEVTEEGEDAAIIMGAVHGVVALAFSHGGEVTFAQHRGVVHQIRR